MNRTESRYADHLDARIADGTVSEWFYEDLTLRLGHDCRLTADFFVVLPDGTLELHEVKSRRKGTGDKFWAEGDALVKLRVCARMFPFKLRVVWESAPGIWREQLIGEGKS